MKFALAIIAAASALEQWMPCKLPDDHVYGVPAKGNCGEMGTGDYSADMLSCCALLLPEDPKANMHDYKDTKLHFCAPNANMGPDWKAGAEANVWTKSSHPVELLDGSFVDVAVEYDCNSAMTMAGASLALAAYILA